MRSITRCPTNLIFLADSHCGFMWEVMVAPRKEVGVSKIF